MSESYQIFRLMELAADMIPQATKEELFGKMDSSGFFIVRSLSSNDYSYVQIKEHPVMTLEFILEN